MGIAHELITRGWHQGEYDGPDGTVCIAGAALRAQGATGLCVDWPESEAFDWAVHDRMCSALEAAAGIKHGIASWNDAPGRTFDEVLRVAKQADEILEAGT